MGFIQPCFIRKNTPELRKKLEELGVVYDGYYGQNNEFIVVDYGPYNNKYDTVNTLPSNVSYHTYDGYKTFDYMDCGDNEDLFIALSALRDDTDVNQWFVMDVEEYMDINQGDWFLATDRNKSKHIGTQIDPMYCHKATVEEIIEHFKK